MKTLVIRRGDRLTIRAIATATDDPNWDKCETLAFFKEHAEGWPKEMEKLGAILSDACENGPPRDETKFKRLPGTDGLYEFKSPQGLRLICFWDEGGLIICSHGYVKDAQKAPKHEIQKGQKIMRNYFLAKTTGALKHV